MGSSCNTMVLQPTGHLDVGPEAAAGGGSQAAARESHELRQTEEQPAACNVSKHILNIFASCHNARDIYIQFGVI